MTDETLLLRQVHPTWVQRGQVTSQAFRPTPKDKSQLSVYDGDLISAAAAWDYYTAKLGHASIGVVSVSVAECKGCSSNVAADPEPFPEHAVIDFTGLSEKEAYRRGKKLTGHAQGRGWQFQPIGHA